MGVPRTERDHAILDCAWVDRVSQGKRSSLTQLKSGFYCDTHDSISRKPWGKLMPLKQDQTIYSFELEHVLNGSDCMSLQGWAGDVNVTGLTDKELRSLSGEGFSVPCATLVHVAYYLNPLAPWWRALVGSKN